MRIDDPGATLAPQLLTTPASARALDRWALNQICGHLAKVPVRLMLWDGTEVATSRLDPLATLLVKTRPALLSWLWNPELNFGEGYMTGAVEVHGDLVALLEAVYHAWPYRGPKPGARRHEANTRSLSHDNVHHHYDLGNEFYKLWLDRDLVYTCAYFPTATTDLDAAQRAKLDLVCRKLRLRPGARVIEAGCGWGALALYMAKQYGASVRAFNISGEQLRFARARAEAEGLADRVEFIEGDYRNIQGTCDVFVSVGMLEHVGLADYTTLGEVIDRTLTRPHGRGLLHFIGRNRPMPLNPWIRKRIFPGAYPPTLVEVSERILEPWNLSVVDVENLRLHYAKTLQHWLARFNDTSAEVAAMFDERFVRAWRLYLAGSQAAFSAGTMQLFQIVFARGDDNDLPWTRAEWLR